GAQTRTHTVHRILSQSGRRMPGIVLRELPASPCGFSTIREPGASVFDSFASGCGFVLLLVSGHAFQGCRQKHTNIGAFRRGQRSSPEPTSCSKLAPRSCSTPYHRNLPQVTALRSIKLLWLRGHSFYVAMRRQSRQLPRFWTN